MKKIFVLSLSIFALIFALCSCDPNNTAANVYDRYETDEDGNQIRVQVMHEFGNKENILIERYHDKNGVLVFEINYDNYAENDVAFTQTFHTNGNRKLVTTYNDDGSYSIDEHDESDVHLYSKEYDSEGRLGTVYTFYPSGFQASIETWDENGNLVNRRKFTDEDVSTVFEDYTVYFESDRTVYVLTVYDGQREKSCDMITKTPSGEFIEHRLDEFSENGDIFRTVQYDELGNVISEGNHKK